MDIPNIVHPKLIKIKGFTFRIASYVPLTDEQALRAVTSFYRTHKLKKADQKKIITVVTSFDQDSVGLL